MLMRKIYFVSLILFCAPLFFFAGCTPASRTVKLSEPRPAQDDASQSHKDYSADYYYLKSRFHIKANEPDRAIIALENAIKKDPGSFILNRDLIQIYIMQKNRDKAVALAESLIEKKPEHVDSLLLFVQLKKDDIDEKKLVDILERILKLDPDNKETFLRLGRIYMDKNDRDQALELFKKMVEKFPDYYVAWYYLGEIHLFDKNYKKANPAFLKTIELEPELLEPRFQLVKVYEALNAKDKYLKIESTYKQVLELDPANHRALLGIALNFYKSGNKKQAQKRFMALGQDIDKDTGLMMAAFDEYLSGENKKDALIVFSQMAKANPENPTLNFFTALAYENLQQWTKALSYYQKVGPSHSQYKKAGLSIALIYKEMGQYDIAVNFLENRLKASPKDIDIITYLSSFYEKQKQYDNGLKLLEKGIEYSPKNTALMFRLGALQDKAGLKQKALDTMAAIIEIDQDDASALNYLGYSYAEMGVKLDQALALIQRANTLRPDDGYITDSLGWVYFVRGDFENAVIHLEKAAQITNFETIIADHLGDAYEKSGLLKKAVKSYQRAISNAEDDDEKLKIPGIEKKLKILLNRLNE